MSPPRVLLPWAAEKRNPSWSGAGNSSVLLNREMGLQIWAQNVALKKEQSQRTPDHGTEGRGKGKKGKEKGKGRGGKERKKERKEERKKRKGKRKEERKEKGKGKGKVKGKGEGKEILSFSVRCRTQMHVQPLSPSLWGRVHPKVQSALT